MPVYQHDSDTLFIYHLNLTTEIFWLIGEQVEGTSVHGYNDGRFDHPQDVDTLWSLATGNDEWVESNLRVVCAEETQRCFSGQLKLTTHLQSAADAILRDLTGTYNLQDSVIERRPVYKQDSAERYLYYYVDATSGEQWVIGSVFGSPDMQYIISGDDSLFPELITAQWYDVLSGLTKKTPIHFVQIQCSGKPNDLKLLVDHAKKHRKPKKTTELRSTHTVPTLYWCFCVP